MPCPQFVPQRLRVMRLSAHNKAPTNPPPPQLVLHSRVNTPSITRLSRRPLSCYTRLRRGCLHYVGWVIRAIDNVEMRIDVERRAEHLKQHRSAHKHPLTWQHPASLMETE